MSVWVLLSVASALLADKHPRLSLDEILKKYEHTDSQKHMESKLDELMAPLPKALDPAHANGLANLHSSVYDLHAKTADLLADAMPTLAPVLHPASTLDHHDRLSAVLNGMSTKDPVDAAAPADGDATADGAADPDAPADAAAEGAADDAPKDAPADADAPPLEKEAVSPEKAAKMATVEKALLTKMGKSLKMMAMLHMMVQPVEKKLTASMANMTGEDLTNAQRVLGHVTALDKLTGTALELMMGMKKAEHGTAAEKKTALVKMIVGLAAIEKGVKRNMLAMHGGEANPAAALTSKLHNLLGKMQAKVDAELNDPERQDDPLVPIDVKMLDTMKKAVQKSESLMTVGAIAMKKAKTEQERQKVKASVKGAMTKVMAKLKTSIQALKQEAVVITKEEEKKEDEAEPAIPEEEAGKADGNAELKGLLDKIAAGPESMLQKDATKEAPHLRAAH